MQSRCPLYPQKRTCAVQQTMSALGQKRTCYPTSSVGISLLQKNARRSGRIHSVANPDAAWSPRGRYPTPAASGRGEDPSSDEEPVVAMYEEPVVAMYERPMMDEVGVMPVISVPAA